MKALDHLARALSLSMALGLAGQSLADEPTSSGTGFAVTSDGWVMTNAHVVQDCSKVEVKGHGEASDARIDAANDLALIRMKADVPLEPLVFRHAPTRLGEDISHCECRWLPMSSDASVEYVVLCRSSLNGARGAVS